MTRRPAAPTSYAASLAVEVPSEQRRQQPPEPDQDDGAGQGRVRRPLEEAADPSVVYLHPAGKKALRLYAVERGVKVHDLLLEAIRILGRRQGLGWSVARAVGRTAAASPDIKVNWPLRRSATMSYGVSVARFGLLPERLDGLFSGQVERQRAWRGKACV